MKELVLVGRGGQGVVLASQVLADTFARAGFFAQSFPEFKAERRGAPISAFLRWDDRPIHRRYKVRECDVLVVVSAAPPTPELLRTVRPGGLVVLNRDSRFPTSGPFHVARVHASKIARAYGILSAEGRPMGNVAVLGACVRLLLPDGLPFLEEAVSARFGALAGPNLAAAREGYVACIRQHTRAGDAPVVASVAGPGPPADAIFPISLTDCRSNHTGSWSEEQPVLTDECTACALCALFCPEGAISRVDGHMLVDALYCKGCGICEVVCPVHNAVHMEEVKG